MTDLVPRWSAYAFFNGGVSKRPTLQEAFNKTGVDSTSAQIADQILFRANLVDRPFYPDLLASLTQVLEDVDNPVYYSNRLDVVNENVIERAPVVVTKDPEAYSVVGENTEENAPEDSDNEETGETVDESHVPVYSENNNED